MVRFFTHDVIQSDHAEYEAFMELFDNSLHRYNVKIQVYQVDCTKDPAPECVGLTFPSVFVYKNGQVLTTWVSYIEPLDTFLDRTLRKADPNKPPEECCDTLELRNQGVHERFAKTPEAKAQKTNVIRCE